MNPEQLASSPADLLHADPLHTEAREVLRRLTGVADAEFHDGQYEAIRALVADRARTLVVQRTGWGKSAVYFISSLLLREIVWTWVPFEEDHSQGKDRPVLLVGRDGEYLLALMMTSKDHNNREHADPNYLDIGSGPWDPQGRASEVKLNRVIRVRPDAMRREGAIMPEDTFRLIERAWTRHNG